MAALAGKLGVITGASRGIGAATAVQLGKQGAQVVLIARTLSDLEKVADQIRENGGTAHCYPADLSDSDQATQVAAKIQSDLGTPDILINNAGLGRWLFVHETPPAEAELMVKLPYLAAFWITHAFLPGMLERGTGRIINVNSPVCIMPWGGATAYASARWALRGFTESLQVDLSRTQIRVAHAVFGEVSSTYFEANPGSHERLLSLAKMIRVLTPEEVANHLVRLAGNRRERLIKPFMVWLLVKSFLGFPRIGRAVLRKTSYRI